MPSSRVALPRPRNMSLARKSSCAFTHSGLTIHGPPCCPDAEANVNAANRSAITLPVTGSSLLYKPAPYYEIVFLTAEPGDAGKRLDSLLHERLPKFSRSRLQSWIKE